VEQPATGVGRPSSEAAVLRIEGFDGEDFRLVDARGRLVDVSGPLERRESTQGARKSLQMTSGARAANLFSGREGAQCLPKVPLSWDESRRPDSNRGPLHSLSGAATNGLPNRCSQSAPGRGFATALWPTISRRSPAGVGSASPCFGLTLLS
jgi:hypothetical protein